MEKKGEFEEASFEFLRNASERELFYLNTGLTMSGARLLLLQIRNMSDEAITHYISGSRNEFADWFEHIFKDKDLGLNLRKEKSKSEIVKHIFNKICELSGAKLKKYGITVPLDKLYNAEEYIESRLSRGEPIFVIKKNLISSGWSARVVDLILENNYYFYITFTSLPNLFEINSAQRKFEELKKSIINAIADGIDLKDIGDYLKNQGWSKNIFEYVLFNVYKPKTNITKLSWFIIKEIGDNNRTVEEITNYLVKAGWKDHIINNLIHKVHTFEDDLEQILSYVSSFDTDEKLRIKEFLKKNGWDESFINQAIKNRELTRFWDYVSESLSLENASMIKFNFEIFKDNILKLKASSGASVFWNNLLESYKKVNVSSFFNNSGELHVDSDYIYYYSKSDIDFLIESSNKGILRKLLPSAGITFYYSTPIKPLLCEINKNKYLISSKIIHKNCLHCNASFPVNKMSKVEIWDTSRTHKITKYVCRTHEKLVSTLMDETRIIQ
ncbi:MAG: hypothetical protein ACLFN8_00365 [Candidatus Woesearchaeota archaeon]